MHEMRMICVHTRIFSMACLMMIFYFAGVCRYFFVSLLICPLGLMTLCVQVPCDLQRG